ncbi:MAG: STAS domain-containing protein [Planctomycetes bacterium]|nr:STAS domain-containing protein [Planctomycetota bacterium]
MSELTIDVKPLAGQATGRILTVSGTVDWRTEPHLQEHFDHLLHAGVRRFLLDMKGVNYVNSQGLGFFVRFAAQLRGLGGRLTLVRVSPMVQVVVRRMRLEVYFDIVETLEEALIAVATQGTGPARGAAAPAGARAGTAVKAPSAPGAATRPSPRAPANPTPVSAPAPSGAASAVAPPSVAPSAPATARSPSPAAPVARSAEREGGAGEGRGGGTRATLAAPATPAPPAPRPAVATAVASPPAAPAAPAAVRSPAPAAAPAAPATSRSPSPAAPVARSAEREGGAGEGWGEGIPALPTAPAPAPAPSPLAPPPAAAPRPAGTARGTRPQTRLDLRRMPEGFLTALAWIDRAYGACCGLLGAWLVFRNGLVPAAAPGTLEGTSLLFFAAIFFLVAHRIARLPLWARLGQATTVFFCFVPLLVSMRSGVVYAVPAEHPRTILLLGLTGMIFSVFTLYVLVENWRTTPLRPKSHV